MGRAAVRAASPTYFWVPLTVPAPPGGGGGGHRTYHRRKSLPGREVKDPPSRQAFLHLETFMNLLSCVRSASLVLGLRDSMGGGGTRCILQCVPGNMHPDPYTPARPQHTIADADLVPRASPKAR